MAEIAPADEGPILEAILDATYEIWNDGLTRPAYGRYYAAQVKTQWGRDHLRRVALVEGHELLASAKIYALDATLDGAPVRIAGLGAVFTQPAHRGRGAAGELIGRVLVAETAAGADIALLFSEIDAGFYARLGFDVVATTVRELGVAQSERHGAPMTMVRAGEDRDLADIALVERTRADGYRLHLNRDRDLIKFAIARKRLLAGLGPAGVREVQFFVAEEGASAVAWVLVTARAGEWTLEAAGDRDPSGARVGAILQVLLARDPAARRPTITGWLPAGFLPPQITVIAEKPPTEIMMLKPLSVAGQAVRGIQEAQIIYWRGDMF
jgi:predicted GNAT family N-acyltransferase